MCLAIVPYMLNAETAYTHFLSSSLWAKALHSGQRCSLWQSIIHLLSLLCNSLVSFSVEHTEKQGEEVFNFCNLSDLFYCDQCTLCVGNTEFIHVSLLCSKCAHFVSVASHCFAQPKTPINEHYYIINVCCMICVPCKECYSKCISQPVTSSIFLPEMCINMHQGCYFLCKDLPPFEHR